MATTLAIIMSILLLAASCIAFMLGNSYETTFFGLHPYVAYPLSLLCGALIPACWWAVHVLCQHEGE
jgi:hypothetical protein